MSNIAVIGDLMLDKFSYGTVNRLNPEGPNPLLYVDSEEYKLGGAANVAANLAGLEHDVDLLGLLGRDAHGKIFDGLCKDHAISLYALFSKSPTTTKQRFIERTYKTQLLRVDYEEKALLAKERSQEILQTLQQIAPKYIVISDYDKGLITQQLAYDIADYAEANQAKILVDAKPNNVQYFDGVYLLKPNFKEFCHMVGNPGLQNSDEQIKHAGSDFARRHRLNLVVTRGDEGAALITKDGKFFSLPTEAKQVFDVTGAGDTFLATIVHALVQGADLKEAVVLGNKASGIVVGRIGTAVITKKELSV